MPGANENGRDQSRARRPVSLAPRSPLAQGVSPPAEATTFGPERGVSSPKLPHAHWATIRPGCQHILSQFVAPCDHAPGNRASSASSVWLGVWNRYSGAVTLTGPWPAATRCRQADSD